MKITYSCQVPLGEGFAIIAQSQVEAIKQKRYLYQSIIPPQKLDDFDFDYRATKLIARGDIFVGWANACLNSLQLAKQLGMKTILNRTSTHIKNQETVLKEESLQLDPKSVERQLKEYELADYILVNSADIIESFKKYSPELVDKIKVINNGVDLEKFKPDYSAKSDKFTVLTVMSNPIRKGLKYLLQAWMNLNLENAELRIIGCNKPSIQLPGSNIKFLGWVSEEDKVKELQQASILCLPSLEEGQSLVVGEAMACGTPVIITDKCGFNQILTKEEGFREYKEGEIIDIRDVQALVGRISWYYKHREECLNKGKEARKLAEKYSWNNYKKEFLEFLGEIC